MCGICGIVAIGRPPETETVRAMSDLIAHRGPDGTGIFAADGVALGHRRLSIIDLSDAGLQPFASDDGALQLLHNGEIYNYRELRDELAGRGHRFRSATDTEVIVAAYREWGDACVERFNGMWAIALWDAARQRLFCSRDRFGVKPFYYSYRDGRFAFASELKAFRALGTPLEANDAAVRDYVEQGYIDHRGETFFRDIFPLEPAHSLVVDANGMRRHRYWRLTRRDPPTGDPADSVRELFLDAVRLRLRSDVRVGTALSGGLDSSAITCAIDHLLRTEPSEAVSVGPRQNTFTAYFEDAGFDERPFAELVVGATNAEPHWISFDADELVDVLPSIVASQDEPFGSASIVAQWFVMREAARAGVKVMLDGQGGDEVLAGYPVYTGAHYADLLAGGRLPTLARELQAARRVQGAAPLALAAAVGRPLLPERLKWRLRGHALNGSELVGPRLAQPAAIPRYDDGPYGDRLRSTMHRILTGQGLPELLHYEDRNSMAHSIEARVPFLDYRLAELLFSLPPDQLLTGGQTKVVLRRALHDLLPPEVRDRTDKLGFVVPAGRFFRGPMGDLAEEVFASRRFAERGFVDAAVARARLAAHRAGRVEVKFELWRALNVELWARAYLDA
jgi:asparagine synthase (glutamine-hydrolysing)